MMVRLPLQSLHDPGKSVGVPHESTAPELTSLGALRAPGSRLAVAWSLSTRLLVILAVFTLLTSMISACGGSTRTTDTASNGGSSNGGSSNGLGGTAAAPETCKRYGIELAADCSQCPATPLSCACLSEFPVFPKGSCTFGSCITAIDCERVCKNAADASRPEFGEDLTAIQECVEVLRRCDSGDDEDCGDGKCVVDLMNGTQLCSTGAPDALCKEPNDCQTGLFCVGFGVCASGEPGDGCDSGAQCLRGTCLVYTPGVEDYSMPAGARGVCTSGLADEPCIADEQCAPPTHCVPLFPARVLGSCSAGAIDDLCNDNGDCQSGFCFFWGDAAPLESGRCTAGGFRDSCVDGSQCESGYCSRQIENRGNPGSCVPGDSGSPCFDDQDCASAHCALLSGDALNPLPVTEGVCTSRASGDPCQNDSECASASCLNPTPIGSASCLPPAGSACENDGVCNGVGLCYLGKCE